MSGFSDEKAKENADNYWNESALEALKQYIRVKNRSPLFVPDNDEERKKEAEYSWTAANILVSWAHGMSSLSSSC